MRFWTTYLTAFLLILLVGYIFIIELPRGKEKDTIESEANKVFAFGADSLQTMRLAYPDHEIILEKSNTGTWKITSPVQTLSDDRAVNSLISTITDMELKRVIEEFNKDPELFGFDSPALKISLTMNDMEEEVIVGDDGARDNTLYIKQGSTQRVVLVDQWIQGSLTKSLYDLRNKKPLSIQRDTVSDLVLAFPARTIHLIKKNQEWWMEDNGLRRADSNIIESLISNLSTLRATRFIDEKEEIRKIRTPNSKETLRLTLTDKEHQASISFYQTMGESEAYAFISDDHPLYEIPKSAVEEFKMDPFYYQDKRLLSFEESSLKKVSIITLNDRYTLQHENNQWVILGESSEIHQDDVIQFFSRMKNVKAEEKTDDSIDLKLSGLDSPTASVTFIDQNDKITASIKVGKEIERRVYALGSTSPEIMLVDKNILDDIPMKNELIKSQAMEDPSL